MFSDDLDKLVEKLHKDFVSRLISKIPDIEKRLTLNKSPLETLGIISSSSREKVLFRSDKEYNDSSECFEIKDLCDIVQATKYALNNNYGYDDYESYSSSLAVALFKYNASSISILKANVNCVMLRLTINGFSWIDLNDDGDKYFQGELNIFIPFKHIFNKEICKTIIMNEIDSMEIFVDGTVFEDMYDIDGIENWSIAGFILDISGVGKNDLNNAVNLTKGFWDSGLKQIISHMKDKECIAYIGDTFADVDVITVNENRKEVVDSLKLYYLLKLVGYEISAKYFKKVIQDKYSYSNKVFNYVDNYMIYSSIYDECVLIKEVFKKHEIDASTMDSIVEGCFDKGVICKEVFDIYNSSVKNCLC